MIRLFINERLEYVFQNPYNMIEVPAVLLYMISFALRYASVFKVRSFSKYTLRRFVRYIWQDTLVDILGRTL